MSLSTTVSVCPPELRAEALRVLHGSLSMDQQVSLVHAIHSANEVGERAFEGLLIALLDNHVVGAAWIQFTAGNTAVVWLPLAENVAAKQLLGEVAASLDSRQIALAQFLVTDEASVDESLLQHGDFERLARLAYLAAEVAPRPKPRSNLVFESCASEDPLRLGKVLLNTYKDSADCPRLNGVRSMQDTITGYREQGTFKPEYWSFVQYRREDVGALLLTFHEDTDNWELVYMGIVHTARGQGFGRQVLDYAFWQVSAAGARQIVLAVDATNQYALEMYRRAGFDAWDHRTVYARLRKE